MKKSKKLSPLEELRMEKELLKSACSEKETNMSSYFSYVSNNLGSIAFNSVIRSFGIGASSANTRSKHKKDTDRQEDASASSTVLQTVWTGLQLTYPYIKDIAQPLIIGFVANKVKNIFTPKERDVKKKK